MFFTKSKIKKLVNESVLGLKEVGGKIEDSMTFLSEFGNKTKRKNCKIPHELFFQHKDRILGYAVPLSVSMAIINDSPFLRKRYKKLLKAFNEHMEEYQKTKQERILKEHVNKIISNTKEE